jgi:hypothetical protein
MGILKKIKSNFLGQNNFSVGFNNNSPVKGVSRKSSPLNNYQSSVGFEGSSGATGSYSDLMKSNYGSPVVPDNKELGDVLSKAVGQFGYMGAQVSNEVGKLLGADGEGGSPWHRQASPLNENGDDDPDNDDKENGDDNGDGENGEGDGTSTQNTNPDANEVQDNYVADDNSNLSTNLGQKVIDNNNTNAYKNAQYQSTWGEGSYGTPDSWKKDKDGEFELDEDGNKIKVKGTSKPNAINARIESMEWW